MAGNLPPESKASLEKSLEDLSIKNKRTDVDIARLSLTGASDTSNTEKKDTKPKKKKKKSRKTAVADSWEDELSDGSSSATETDERENGQVVTATNMKDLLVAKEGPLAPPPTPSTIFDEQDDTDGLHPRWSNVSAINTTRSATTSSFMTRDQEQPRARPEKQTAVASRMIAGALGIRAPKRTEEQRAYDRAMKEKEIKRRNKEKEEAARAKEDEERAKAAVWDS